MRTSMIGLVLSCLLGGLAPASAQTADPLGLIASGAVLPYFGDGRSKGEVSILEVSSPVGGNATLHMLFFDQSCAMSGVSVGLPLTANDVERLVLEGIQGLPDSGLMAIGSAEPAAFDLRPLTAPIHARVTWINPGQDFARVLEPIALANAEPADPSQVWNPLRSAASFYAPPDRKTTHSTLVLICPTANIITQAFPPAHFPALVPQPVASGPTPLRVRVYDDGERFLRDVNTSCRCVSKIPLTALTPIYADIVEAPAGGGATDGAFFSFTGYLATRAGGRDMFGRLSSGSAPSLRGTLAIGVR
jgi:hypothetical protein